MRVTRREADQEYPGALSELPSGERPEFDLSDASILSVTFSDGRRYSWSSAVGWVPQP